VGVGCEREREGRGRGGRGWNGGVGRGGGAPCVHDEGAGGRYAAAEAEQGLEHVANVGAAALPQASTLPTGHVEVALEVGMKRDQEAARRREEFQNGWCHVFGTKF
jgi:hypothetical protein